MKRKAEGQRGSWFASVDGERLPCVHKHWWKNGRYHDPEAKPGDRKVDELASEINNKKMVILTDDEIINGKLGDRKGYIAIYQVDDIHLEEGGLRFEFKKRIEDLR